MWAFLLWDGRRRELFCARDRFGIKPLYYTVAGGSFLAASEIKALLAHPGVGAEPNDAALLTFLAYGVLDHSDQTMFAGVRQIPPAHFMVVSSAGAGAATRYWDLRVNPAPTGPRGQRDEHAGRLLQLLRDSVRLELRSDVPVGTCLSGGIDSSTLAVLIGERIRSEGVASVGERQNTFSACYADPRFDECGFVDIATAATGAADHRTYPNAPDLEADLAHLVRMQDEPFSSLSIYAQYRVMKLARESVKVVLDGQGADELLGGYLAYQGSYVRGLLRQARLLSAIREIAGSARCHGGFFRDAATQLRVRAARRALLRMTPVPVQRYRGSLDQVLRSELVSTNLPALLHWEDRNSMAFSIEARVPYLDHRLVEFIAGLPLDEKIRGGITKVALRRAIKGLVPEAIRCRMDKMGFVAPEEVWMKEQLRPFVLRIFASPSFRRRKYWDPDRVAANYREFLDGKAAYSSEIWRIVSAELWLREFFDARAGVAGLPG